MKKILFFSLFAAILFFSSASFVFAQEKSAEIYFFYSATCPHCAAEKEFLNDLGKKYPELKINQYEVIQSPENQKILKGFYEKYKVPTSDQGWVPVTFTSKKYFVGFNDQVSQGIEGCVEECLAGAGTAVPQKVRLPFFGEVDASKISLPLLTLVLGTLDGFNPCAMWILIVLVSLLIPLKSRKKIALVGGTFIFAEGLLYFLIMAAWLNAFLVISYVSLTRILIGIVGIGFGVWRLKDFFFWRPGVCKVVSESGSQQKILAKIKNILKPSAVPVTIFGVIALAFSVNIIEFVCSAGFPVIYTRVLALQSIGTIQYYLYLIFYNLLYVLDDLIIFGFAFFTLNRFGFSDKYNRYSTLIAGVLIFILGLLLIFKPGLLMFG